jgi:NADPH:quinone reductase-like Zn-dependent oxidoreductase
VPTTMTAAVLDRHGGPEALHVRHDVPVPDPGPGEVLVAVAAAGVNNTDLWTRRGAYGRPGDPDATAAWRGVPLTFPRIQGGDGVGRVSRVGADVDRALVGRRVLVDPITYGPEVAPGEPALEGILGSERDGAFAQLVCVDADAVHDVTGAPLSDAQLACLPIAYGTATGMLERAGLRTGETIVVTGASGGVGLALVQLAAARGARVVAVTSSRTEEAVRDAGADAVVARDVVDDVAAACTERVPEGAEVVADVVGGEAFGGLVDVLAAGGRLVTCGAIAGPVVALDLRRLYLERRRLIGSTMHTREHFRRLVEDAVAGRLAPVVARTYPLADIHRAQEDFTAAEFVGKLVLEPPPT